MKRGLTACALLALSLLLGACSKQSDDTPPPAPHAAIPQDAVGHYCGMFLYEHKGPKGQILLRDREQPVWFTTIRELFAYTQLPEEPKAIVAAYVQDMAKMTPEGNFPNDAWIDARKAHYVIHSRFTGGMGTQDALPFGTEDAAQAFQRLHGGEVISFETMPESYIFDAGMSVPVPSESPGTTPAGAAS
ncbi:copper resistance protein CopZ [Pusillimonas sp. TS35]|uniref:nitrous oxide reductase accessory protein NosL n=1 Tax=Paracandidimonas lactea TaxID=2895524 RepID=UPI001371ADC4|nr:nitrous oxide reductase accessory protein NosL [Paracandidimonas lactea]MYN12812.1 copper resistance protein CopZ [Pusillimonas sp. TS35]